ncbi:hypothetical protein WOLCODRAFT_161370 [Wolfiporia cocos MD-104 SS10]|uniref:Uncharacterized protein n=1 Tax=Wolfiporia cocos (strain MD-104) TaxID=742152 RepID=A0A2H3JNH4_WOLCO|nr:hypothetical protein WOLCODRAFT_161370 [Wolfiporia cocos MD-104 SS10]
MNADAGVGSAAHPRMALALYFGSGNLILQALCCVGYLRMEGLLEHLVYSYQLVPNPITMYLIVFIADDGPHHDRLSSYRSQWAFVVVLYETETGLDTEPASPSDRDQQTSKRGTHLT